MYYFVFDMDETIAELYSVFYFIASLRLRETLKESSLRHKLIISDSFERQIQRAYRYFVKRILAEELSNKPLGILRPGIQDVMMELLHLKNKGIVKNVVIYSNNSHLQSLEFIRDLIHEYLGTDLIKDCIHWNHPMRGEEKIIGPGFSNKTWSVLKKIMIHGNCQVPAWIQRDQVHFFDDLEHKDLKRELQENYHLVTPYNFKASFERISAIYKECIIEAGVDVNQLLDFVIQLLMDKEDIVLIDMDDELESIVEMFHEKTRATVEINKTPPMWDSGVNRMMDVVEKVAKNERTKERIPDRESTKGGFSFRNRKRRRTRRKYHRRGSSQTNRKRQRTRRYL